MAQYELIMPKMGESIMEATILRWTKKEGDTIEVDETIVEIATDKVDSEIPSPVGGKIVRLLFKENETAEVGKVIAIISTEAEETAPGSATSVSGPSNSPNGQPPAEPIEPAAMPASAISGTASVATSQEKNRGEVFLPTRKKYRQTRKYSFRRT